MRIVAVIPVSEGVGGHYVLPYAAPRNAFEYNGISIKSVQSLYLNLNLAPCVGSSVSKLLFAS